MWAGNAVALQPEPLSCYGYCTFLPVFSALSLAQESRRCHYSGKNYVAKESHPCPSTSWLCDICAKFAKSTRLYHSRASCRSSFCLPRRLGTHLGIFPSALGYIHGFSAGTKSLRVAGHHVHVGRGQRGRERRREGHRERQAQGKQTESGSGRRGTHGHV
ncbi:hypothetical protein GGR52DRAFT_522890 [Hypoxylon sp. FL1284]|nr:hypothetical protein GGR52DRAFT_522890 [Hypoxylon sp. FL1284]